MSSRERTRHARRRLRPQRPSCHRYLQQWARLPRPGRHGREQPPSTRARVSGDETGDTRISNSLRAKRPRRAESPSLGYRLAAQNDRDPNSRDEGTLGRGRRVRRLATTTTLLDSDRSPLW